MMYTLEEELAQREYRRMHKKIHPWHTAASYVPSRHSYCLPVSTNYALPPIRACDDAEPRFERTLTAMATETRITPYNATGKIFQGNIVIVQGVPVGIQKNHKEKSLLAAISVPGEMVRGWLYQPGSGENKMAFPETDEIVTISEYDRLDVRPNRRLSRSSRSHLLERIDSVIREYIH